MENASKGVVLVVDDKPLNLEILFEHLDLEGFKVFTAQNGRAALKHAAENLPDIILLDIMMPGINGFETCRRLKANEATKHIPVIFMTALSGTQNIIEGFEAGGVDYITKPFQSQELLARIQAHLKIRQLQEELRKQNQKLEEYAETLARKNVQLDEKNRQLQEVNATKDRFFSIISHDLKGQLGELKGFPELIKEHLDAYTQDELKKLLTDFNKPIEQLYALFENLFTWSKIQSGMIECYPEPMNVKDIISRNISVFTTDAGQKQILLRSTIQEQFVVWADSDMIDMVVTNLLSNAIKFTPEGGTINISAEQREHDIVISISDSGIGMRAEHISNLFRIDVQYQQKGTAGEKGTGLGLIICKKLLESNGGDIWVESGIGNGTTFRFSLPHSLTRNSS